MNRFKANGTTAAMGVTRRTILQGCVVVTTAGLGSSIAMPSFAAQATELALTPSCDSDEAPTPAGTEGPYFMPSSPAKSDFRADAAGEAFVIMGWVLTRDCRPIANAVIDLWHADANGEYDNEGYRLRGHQSTDAAGRYVFQTIVPGPYDDRTRHYHVKVRAPGGRLLTTQLYFPGEARNARDFLFDGRLLMQIESTSTGRIGRFDFVLADA